MRRKKRYSFGGDPAAYKAISKARRREFRKARINHFLDNSSIFQKYLKFTSRFNTISEYGEFFGFAPPYWRKRYFFLKGWLPVALYENLGRDGDYILLYNRKTQEFRKVHETQ